MNVVHAIRPLFLTEQVNVLLSISGFFVKNISFV
jgi:hypothetical protein